MNTTLSSRLCKGAIMLVGALISYQSALLTYDFMSGLSSTLGVIGLLMELVKFFCPILALYAFRQGAKTRALILSSITLLLTAMSFTASYASVNTGFQSERQQSQQYKALSEQIQLQRNTSKELRAQAGSLPKNYITKRASLLEQAKQSDLVLSSLLSKRALLKTDSVADQYGRMIALATAFIIELLTVSVSVALSLFRQSDNQQDADRQQPALTVTEPAAASVTVKTAVTEPEHLSIVAEHEESKEQQIKKLVITKQVKPSVRGVRELISGISNDKISAVLKALGEAGVLNWNGRGWRFELERARLVIFLNNMLTVAYNRQGEYM